MLPTELCFKLSDLVLLEAKQLGRKTELNVDELSNIQDRCILFLSDEIEKLKRKDHDSHK